MAEGTANQDVEILRPNIGNGKEDCKSSRVGLSSLLGRQLTLEPALFGATIAIYMCQTSLQNFYLRTACLEKFPMYQNICYSGVGEEFRMAEKTSQAFVTELNVGRGFVGGLLSTIVLLFLGPWSDCSGRRKPLLILSLLGMSVMMSGVLLMLTFPGLTTVQVLYAVQIPMSVGGNFGLLLAAAFSYIGDICHATGRDVTSAMGVHRAAIQVAQVIGAVSGPLIYRRFGFYGVFPIVLFLQVSSLIYVIVRVKDVNVNINNDVSVLNVKLPLDAMRCLGRPRDGNRRKILMLMLAVAFGDRVILAAEVSLAYMFYRLKFNWDDIMFGSFIAYRNIMSFAGTLLILTILKRRFKISDEVVGAFSGISFIFGTTCLIATQSTIIVFLVPIIGIIAQGSQVVQRPILNQQIQPKEQGKIYCIMGALEQACQMVAAPLYNLLYTNTMKTVPEAWLLPGIALVLLQILAYLASRRLGQADMATVPTPLCDITLDNTANKLERKEKEAMLLQCDRTDDR